MTFYRPQLNHEIRFAGGRLDIRLLELVTTQSVEINAEYEGRFDERIRLASIRISVKGVCLDIPIYLRVVATGEAEARFEVVLETRFGVKNNNPFFSREITHEFDFSFTARVELMAHIEARLNILGVLGLYGIYGNLGLGLETSTDILNMCSAGPFPFGGCFVVGTFPIVRMGSIQNYGLTRIFPSLNFGPIHFLPNMPTHFHYFYGGTRHRACPHRLEDIDLNYDLLGEWSGVHTGSWSGGGFSPLVIGLRSNNIYIFHDGFNYRALVQAIPFEGGIDGRVNYYADVTINDITGEFSQLGTTIVYNPDGGNWVFYRWTGVLSGNEIRGTSARDNTVRGPFLITRTGVTYLPVTSITGAPTTTPVNTPLTLTAAVAPANATFQDITWSIVNARGSGATITNGVLTAPRTGTAPVTVRASIPGGLPIGSFTQDFQITITPAPGTTSMPEDPDFDTVHTFLG
jgi:hypothetical protein